MEQVFLNVTIERLEEIIKQCLLEVANKDTHQSAKEIPIEPLNVKQAAEILDLAVSSIYSKVSRRELPFCKRGKRLYFWKDELLEYVRNGKVDSVREIHESSTSLLIRGRGL